MYYVIRDPNTISSCLILIKWSCTVQYAYTLYILQMLADVRRLYIHGKRHYCISARNK